MTFRISDSTRFMCLANHRLWSDNVRDIRAAKGVCRRKTERGKIITLSITYSATNQSQGLLRFGSSFVICVVEYYIAICRLPIKQLSTAIALKRYCRIASELTQGNWIEDQGRSRAVPALSKRHDPLSLSAGARRNSSRLHNSIPCIFFMRI